MSLHYNVPFFHVSTQSTSSVQLSAASADLKTCHLPNKHYYTKILHDSSGDDRCPHVAHLNKSCLRILKFPHPPHRRDHILPHRTTDYRHTTSAGPPTGSYTCPPLAPLSPPRPSPPTLPPTLARWGGSSSKAIACVTKETYSASSASH